MVRAWSIASLIRLTLKLGLLSETNLLTIDALPIEQLVVTNTVPQTTHAALCQKLVTLDISPTIAESIRRIHNGESISLLFGEWADLAGFVSVDEPQDGSSSGSRTPKGAMSMTMSAMSPIVQNGQAGFGNGMPNGETSS